MRSSFVAKLLAVVAMAACLTGAAAPADSVRYSRDIRPILSENCFKCHGIDDKSRKGKLRLDDSVAALEPAKSGARALIPGKPDESELIKRILSEDPDEVMPPPATKKTLTAEQKKRLKDWVAAGAKYEPHWAFVPPKQTALPKISDPAWPRNAIDHFVLARLDQESLKPSPPATRHVLARRLYLDLIGLPPTTEEADAFASDSAPDAWERLVNRLLDSPQYGERWARRWLDLARYADTNGYEKDRPRSIWPYRDWVIQALNDDMPFDEFTIKQIAGDLLPNPTLADRVATGFHRNTMLNEEGGNDPLEFRYHSLVDRVAVTGTTWLGLTIGCAQCHTHKFDPITHHEYYQLMAFLNNTQEPKTPIPSEKNAAKRSDMATKIALMEAALPTKFEVIETLWESPETTAATTDGVKTEHLPDGSWRFGEQDKADYHLAFQATRDLEAKAIRIESIADETLPGKGAGHGNAGNFVITEAKLSVADLDGTSGLTAVKFGKAEADFAQDGFAADKAVDGDDKTGWGVAKQEAKNHTLTLELDKPIQVKKGARCELVLEQHYGSKHVLGRVKISLGVGIDDPRPREVRQREALQKGFAAWNKTESEKAVHWTPLPPIEAKSNEPILNILDDLSVLASGDLTKSDTYQVRFAGPIRNVTAIRLEALPHPSLPRGGPGRVYYEGPEGDFTLCELKAFAGGKPLKFKTATVDFFDHQTTVEGKAGDKIIDGDPLTGWFLGSGDGKAHAAVLILDEPLNAPAGLEMTMLFERHFACGLGRFRVSVTSAPQAAARGLPAEVEAIAFKPEQERNASEKIAFYRHYLSMAPELAEGRKEIQTERDRMPKDTTTLTLVERPPGHERKTHLHNRGEYLQPVDEVSPAVPAVLPGLGPDQPANRLGFARWLVSKTNPLTARVVVNRQWQAFFGRGLVRTVEDFGFQGAAPSHPELLDWLAVEFMSRGWSLKQLHRLIVTSATYQQSSVLRLELNERDPQNILLARGPRFRVDAEIVRDSALRASGLLSTKVGGPSVFPPQPPGITTEGAYGPLTWTTSAGEDRYRRSLYTYAKRTAPFAMFNTFDGPTGEACLARREVSNTPLQSLALLNDVMMVEMAQALAAEVSRQPGGIPQKAAAIFRRCLTRPPTPEEQAMLTGFYQAQMGRLNAKEIDAAKLSGVKESPDLELAAWTTVARAVLNLDETITKE